MKIDQTRLRRFYALLKQAGVSANKEDILSGYGVDSANDLSIIQMDEILNTLQNLADGRDKATPEIRKARSRVLTLCTDLGVFNGSNWKALNEFLTQKRIAGKLLYLCDIDELKALNKKLSGMLRQRIAKVEEDTKKAISN